MVATPVGHGSLNQEPSLAVPLPRITEGVIQPGPSGPAPSEKDNALTARVIRKGVHGASPGSGPLMLLPLRTVPGPRLARGIAAEQHRDATRGVVRHAMMRPWPGTCGRNASPLLAIPFPRVARPWRARCVPAEQDDALTAAVVRHGVMHARTRRRGRIDTSPRRTIPRPCVRRRATVRIGAPIHHGHAARGIIRHGVMVSGAWGFRVSLEPDPSIPLPGVSVSRSGGQPEAPVEHESISTTIERRRRERAIVGTIVSDQTPAAAARQPERVDQPRSCVDLSTEEVHPAAWPGRRQDVPRTRRRSRANSGRSWSRLRVDGLRDHHEAQRSEQPSAAHRIRPLEE
jgi:hypothetical protein